MEVGHVSFESFTYTAITKLIILFEERRGDDELLSEFTLWLDTVFI